MENYILEYGWALLIGLGGILGLGLLILGLYCIIIYNDWFRNKETYPSYLHEEGVNFTIAGIVCLILGAFLITFCPIYGSVKITESYNTSFNEHMYDIITLDRAGGINGSRLKFEDTQNYLVYHETEYGYKLDKLNSKYTYIKESDKLTPGVYKWKESGSAYFYYTIYCPVGTIDAYIYRA